MTVWDELKRALVRLRAEQPGTLLGYPDPDVDEGRRPPFELRLAAWAVAAAEQLHRQFGDNVGLIVGALPYPPGRQPQRSPAPGPTAQLLDQREVTASEFACGTK